jgi:hypothetical protein
MPAQRRLRRRSSGFPTTGPVTRSGIRRQLDSLVPSLDVFTTPTANSEIGTEPASPTSPTLHTKAYRRILRRERSALFVQAILQYDRSEDDLQPWLW